MKEIKATKYPTLKQMSRMASNLRKKYQKHCTVDRTEEAEAHSSSENVYIIKSFKIYIAPAFHECDSWQHLQDKYNELMTTEVAS